MIVQALARMIMALKERGYTIVMVEQNFHFVAPLADRFYVMEHGQIVEHFEAAELSRKQGTLNELLWACRKPACHPPYHGTPQEEESSHEAAQNHCCTGRGWPGIRRATRPGPRHLR